MAGLLALRVDGGSADLANRCLALTQAWRDRGGEARLFTTGLPDALVQQFGREGVAVHVLDADASELERADQTLDALPTAQVALVLAGRAFDLEVQRRARRRVARLIVIDDHGAIGEYAADLIVDQSLDVDPRLYRRRPRGCVLLLGPDHALLRREFRLAIRPGPRGRDAVRRLLVLSEDGVAAETEDAVLAALRRTVGRDVRLRVLVAAGSERVRALQAVARSFPVVVELESGIEDVSGRMAWADLAIANAGGVAWELATMGVPAVLLSTSEEQARLASSLAEHGAAVDAGRFPGTSVASLTQTLADVLEHGEARRSMSVAGPELVDGRGAERVVEAIRSGRPGGGEGTGRVLGRTRNDAGWPWRERPGRVGGGDARRI